MTARAVLIGLDGATFTVLDPLMRDGVMPFLRSFVGSGVRADLRTIIPALTPPAWTSLVTGRSPGHHGVFDFFVKEAVDGPSVRFATSRDVHADTIWSMVNRHGGRVTVLNFPVMFPPPPLDGYVVAGLIPWRQLRLGCHPATLYDRLKSLPGFKPQELAMDTALEGKALEGCREEEYEDWIDLHIRREQRWSDVLRTLMTEDPCALTAVLFDGVDKIQHLCWRFVDPALAPSLSSAWELRIRERCLEYFRQLDNLLAEIVDRAGPEATVVMASDHGFGPQVGTFFVNAWLAERGYLTWVDSHGAGAQDPGDLGISQLARHVYQIDWERTKAYVPTPGANGIYIVRAAAGRSGGVPEAEYARFRDRLRDELLAFADPVTGRKIVAAAHTRDEVFAGPYAELAPDLTLELEDGGLVSIVAADAAYRQRPEPTGTHRPEGIFIARGPGMRSGAVLPTLSILDVAPLLLEGLALQCPAGLEGRVSPDIFEAPRARGVAVAAPVADVAVESAPSDGVTLDPEAEKEILRRLQALGYIE